MKVIAATVAALVMATSAMAGQEYECKQSIFGCFTTYTGTTTPADVVEYVEDSKLAVKEVTKKYQLPHVIYQPTSGVLVLKTTKENWLPNSQEVKAIFDSKNLYVSKIAYTWPNSNEIRSVREYGFNSKGRVRALALAKVPTAKDLVIN